MYWREWDFPIGKTQKARKAIGLAQGDASNERAQRVLKLVAEEPNGHAIIRQDTQEAAASDA